MAWLGATVLPAREAGRSSQPGGTGGSTIGGMIRKGEEEALGKGREESHGLKPRRSISVMLWATHCE